MTHRSAGRTIAYDLIDRIQEGELAPGDALPDERSLIATYGVGRRGAREAMVALVTLGIAELRPGRGAVVLRRDVEPVDGPGTWLVGEAALAELYALRAVIEAEAARRAASLATAEDVAVLTRHEEAYAAAGGDHELLGATDELLHAAIVAAAGSTLHSRLAAALAERIALARRRALRTHTWLPRTVRDHALLCAAIRDRRPEIAAERMREHVEGELRAIASTRSPAVRRNRGAPEGDG